MRKISVIAPHGHAESIRSLAEDRCVDCWFEPVGEDGRQAVHLLVTAESTQTVLDGLQSLISHADNARIIVSGVETTLPVVKEEDAPRKGMVASREELLSELEKKSRMDATFFILIFLSTVVAAVGLIKDNVAVVVGAMVIAPLLGPNLSLALGTALGDRHLMGRSLGTNAAGLALTLALSMAVGLIWPLDLDSRELIARTDVGLDSVALALASGAAAVLSLTTGLSSVLVGVMVAVALMPPAVTLGLMLVSRQPELAAGALLLLAVNVVCVNFAANVVFFAKGVAPRTWRLKKQARRSMLTAIGFWFALLVGLMIVIFQR
ncbi:MAG: TIGR00341 family protein [Xanthomonadales bacterium]|nr:TIGR00341 family protein [Gammaproteobacteria bacterium]NNJ65239.1 TIGR00341 family protein [Xanthomonadales bacterium]NNK32957.1 TIGR00341 family protein [Xanthomonadales bacterium]